jgi:hypothetical protein
MEIEINTRSKRKDSIAALAKFYAIRLNLLNSKRKLVINVQSNLVKENGWTGVVGESIDDDSIIMFIDSKLSDTQLMITLAHEMVHVKQYAKGQMSSKIKRNVETRYWLGKPVKKNQYHYHNSPWELEAFSKERILANEFTFFVEQLIKDSK